MPEELTPLPCPMESAIDAYIEDYVMEGDEGSHQPNEADQAVIKDAIMGLLSDADFLAAWNRRAQPAAQALPAITEQQSKWGRLYTAANALVVQMGYRGSMQADSIEMESLKDKLHDLDGGEWMPGLMPPAQPVAPADAAPSVAPEPLKGWKLNHVQFVRGTGKAEIGYLDSEDDRFSPIVTVDTGLYYEPDQAHPLAVAILGALQAAHPPRAPLTDEQLSQIMESVNFTFSPTLFARAIEAAHGIRGQG